MCRVKQVEKVFWQLFAAFSVVKPDEKEGKTTGGTVKQHKDGTCDTAQCL